MSFHSSCAANSVVHGIMISGHGDIKPIRDMMSRLYDVPAISDTEKVAVSLERSVGLMSQYLLG